MITYVALCKFTAQGIGTIRDSPKRAEAFKKLADKFGVVVREILWTQGQYDIVIVADAPDEYTASALDLEVCALGNMRTETLRAFSHAEMERIVTAMAAGSS